MPRLAWDASDVPNPNYPRSWCRIVLKAALIQISDRSEEKCAFRLRGQALGAGQLASGEARPDRQPDVDDEPPRNPVLRLDRAAHRFDVAPGDRQPDAKASGIRPVLRPFAARREIALENLVELPRRHSRTLVADLDMRDVALLPQPHEDLAPSRRKRGGVVDQVLDDRLDDRLAAEHIDAGRQFAAQPEIAAGQQRRAA